MNADPSIQAQEKAVMWKSPPARASGSVQGRRIVVVDDGEGVRSMLRDVLQAHGLDVQLANDGRSALHVIRQHQPDLVLSDINMPGLDGYELLEQIRQDPETAQMPFVLMTGKADLHGMRNGMTLGADDYLPKPFSISELINVIKRRLSRQEALTLEAESRMDSLRNSITLMLPHELLTPLNGIIGIASLLECGDTTAEDLATFGPMLRDSGERLHRLILNFLTLAQLELVAHDPAKLARLREEEVSTEGGWIDSLAHHIASGQAREADLTLDLTTTPLRVGISRNDLEKILTELLDNAFKFSAPATPVALTCHPKGSEARLAVRDSGRGMKKEHLEQLGAFQQFDRKLHEQQGSGLGVIIAKRLVELHGGAFTIESAPDVGTTVHFTLPLRAAHPDSPPPETL